MKGLAIKQTASINRTFSEADLAEYGALTGDTQLGYGDSLRSQTLVPGPLIGGLFSYLLGVKLPGRGTNWLKQQLQFSTPAFIGEELTATVEIIRLRHDKDLVNLRTTCVKAGGAIVCQGEALVLVRDLVEAQRREG